jgi:glycosyltransferase involved in cell wall biosynthesis
VAFRSLPRQEIEAAPPNVTLLAIDPGAGGQSNGIDDEATRGVNPLSHLRYFRIVRSFARRHAGAYDLVFEKGWRVSGYLLNAFQAYGTRGAVIENDARCWTDQRRDLRTWMKYALHRMAQSLAGHYSRRAPVVIAETEELRAQLVKVRGIPEQRIKVVPLGVDQELFRPSDQGKARLSLGIHPDKTTTT